MARFLLLMTLLPAALWATPQAPDHETNPFIMSRGILDAQDMADFLLQYNPQLDPSYVRFLSRIYIQESAREGVNHDIAFAQMILETNYLRFGGQVAPEQNNFSGIGALDDGRAGAFFESPREGVRAQIQHLKAYGSNSPLNTPQVDPRFHLVRRSSALTFLGLAGRWATDPRYGTKIMTILQRLRDQRDTRLALAD